MYHHIHGELVVLSPTRAVVEAAGVGYELSIPFSTYRVIKDRKHVRLLTHLLVRQDLHRLFGFFSEPERLLFRTILSVSGVGPSTCLAILSSFEVDAFTRVIESRDPSPLRKIKGIGQKLAERLVVELRDRIQPAPGRGGERLYPNAIPGWKAQSAAGLSEVASEAVQALMELGYTRREGEERVGTVLRAQGNGKGFQSGTGDPETLSTPPPFTVETLLMEALRIG